jgi:hypothetical protein
MKQGTVTHSTILIRNNILCKGLKCAALPVSCSAFFSSSISTPCPGGCSRAQK